MKHLELFENWLDKFISKKSAKNWLDKNEDKMREISDKDLKFGTNLTIEEEDFMDKYYKMYKIVHNDEICKYYNDYPAAHKPISKKQSREALRKSTPNYPTL